MSGRRFITTLDGSRQPERELVGGKAWSIARMLSLGLRVPPAYVLTTDAFRAFDRERDLPSAMLDEIAEGLSWLESRTDRRFGASERPLLVSVRSGAAVSMPGMMDTVLNLGMNDVTEAALARESGDPAFARDTHRRFLELFAEIVLKAHVTLDEGQSSDAWRSAVEDAAGEPVPADPIEQLHRACRAVFESWNSSRAVRYRKHRQIPSDLGTAVTVQAMVFGNLGERSGTGVLFSRNPLTGANEIYGEYLRRAQGEDVVSGKVTPEPLSKLATTEPDLYREILDASAKLERANREIQDIEFTVQEGLLYLLQSRAAKLAPVAAVETSVDLVREGVLDEQAALMRLSPDQIRLVLAPRLAAGLETSDTLACGVGACPGVGIGVAVDDPDEAARRAASGEAVVLVRQTTSPNDVHGMLAAVAVVTEQGGSTSHAAVVSRALGLPCVVGCGAQKVAELTGRLVTVDGASGKVFPGRLAVETPDERTMQALQRIAEWARERSPIAVVEERAPGVVDLDEIEGGADPERIGSVVGALDPAAGATGGAIASEAGVRAAIEAGLAFIVARPALPVLLCAAQIAIRNVEQKEIE